jgi:hypothetical protein
MEYDNYYIWNSLKCVNIHDEKQGYFEFPLVLAISGGSRQYLSNSLYCSSVLWS